VEWRKNPKENFMSYRMLAASLAASLAVASSAMAASAPGNDTARIASQYSSWAGSRANAEAIVTGLHDGSPITIVTTGADRSMSLAGFSPAGPMSYDNVKNALLSAQRALVRMGISKPTAEQIQAALIGGEVELPGGRTQALRGTVAVRGGNPQLATR
jgi:hypothetical protein